MERFEGGWNPGGRDGEVWGGEGSVPLTQNQMDVNHRPTGEGEWDSVTLGTPKFASYLLHIPTTAPAKTPSALIRGGPQADRCLLNPDERREIMEFERDNARALGVIKSAGGAESRLHNLMRQSFKNGAIGVDKSSNGESRIYGDTARKTRERMEGLPLAGRKLDYQIPA